MNKLIQNLNITHCPIYMIGDQKQKGASISKLGSSSSQQKWSPNGFSVLRNLQNPELLVPTSESQHKYYQISTSTGQAIRIYFMTHSIIRVRFVFDYKACIDRSIDPFRQASYSLVLTAWQDRFDQIFKDCRRRVRSIISVNFELRDSSQGKYYYFQTNQLIGKIFHNPYGLQIYNKNGQILYKDLKGRAYKRDLQGRIYHYNQIDQQTDLFYGFGQTTGRLNKFGSRIRLSPQDSLGYDAEKTSTMYKHIPFYQKINKKTKHAIGLFYNNSYEAVFDMGSERSGYWPRYSYYSADGGNVDLFIINGPTMKRVIQRYTDLTGKTALSPIQALGYLGSTMYYAQLEQKCDKAIIDFVQKCAKENVPISNFHLSSGYTLSQNKQAPKRNIFTWNSKKFPNPSQFFSNMKSLGVSVSPNVKPGILLTHHLYDQFASNMAFIKSPQNPSLPYVDRWWGGQGSFVDFTDKKARQLWKKHLKQQLIMNGTLSIWNDNNQYQSLDNRGALCSYDNEIDDKNNPMKYERLDELRTVQSLLMAHIADEAIKQCNPYVRPYIITRSGCAGIQRYASSWSGDNFTSWKTLRGNISTMLNMGLSGFANYGSDIGGFWGPSPTPQLFLRWIQHGIFQPRFSIHSCNSDNTVTQPWMFPQFSKLISKTIRFRYLLLPYLYSLLYFSHIKGRPIMRALVYQFQDTDVQACSQQHQVFMLGPYMLISNILQPLSQLSSQPTQTTKLINEVDFINFPSVNFNVSNIVQINQYQFRHPNRLAHSQSHYRTAQQIKNQFAYQEVYLPKGCNWYAWNGRDKYPGGSTVRIKVGLESIPIFVKDKSIIPLAIRFGKKQSGLSISEINKQVITGLYIKICYDNDSTQQKGVSLSRQKNSLQFMIYQDNGSSPISKSGQKDERQYMTQSTLGTFQRIYENRLNTQIPTNSSFCLTKISVKNPQIKPQTQVQQRTINTNMLIIDIQRQGNLDQLSISTAQRMILQIKSVQICPIWITINDKKCKQVLNQTEWTKWEPKSIEKLKSFNRINLNESEVQIQEYGCWYYDHEKGAAIVKINKYLVRPVPSDVNKYRNLHIRVCKDKLIQFTKQYSNLMQQIQDNSQQKIKNQVVHESDEIEQQISSEEYKKIKERRRIIIKQKQKQK